METETEQPISEYIALFDAIAEKVNGEAIALAIMHEMSKDRRAAEISAERETKSERPATEKQKEYLRKLNVPVPANLTKREASTLIDQHTGQNGE